MKGVKDGSVTGSIDGAPVGGETFDKGTFPTVGKERRDRQARRPATMALMKLQFSAKKLREQQPWKVEKLGLSWEF
jgi:hypothetical protein